WLGGGACHIDTWDPKQKGDGRKKAGSYYDPVSTAIAGASVCQHLSRTAPLLDRAVLVRTLHHDAVDEHAAATNRLHTGRPGSSTRAMRLSRTTRRPVSKASAWPDRAS